ncbi:MAG: hypothetical protein HYT38_00330 [Candidatus Sungbacteria bacterium]|uniref:Uncharacterized protein n=1 Tax=Candidatus Sungiibacteriota bacterium TaxID=2750080 RepID=A0A9D6HPH6_9BACT|nr:hypothetical protein [Candidatus Sungbacteria bacterium]
MFKLLLYTALFTVGGYALVTRLPDTYKGKMLAAIGLGDIEGKSFVVFNPASKRENLLAKLEENLAKVENIQNPNAQKTGSVQQKELGPGDPDKSILIEGRALPPGQLAPLIQEQKEIIEQLKDLNPQTGLVPKIMGKILGLDSPPPVSVGNITPELKAEICK